MEHNTYLSDDEVDIENEQIIELDQYGMPIDNIDEEEELEMRKIVSNKILSMTNINEDTYSSSNNLLIKKISSKDLKNQKKKTISLEDLNNIIEKKIEEKKPKKFISKRSLEKKNKESEKEIIKKRTFNPRLIPYLFSDEYLNSKLYNESCLDSSNNLLFPKL